MPEGKQRELDTTLLDLLVSTRPWPVLVARVLAAAVAGLLATLSALATIQSTYFPETLPNASPPKAIVSATARPSPVPSPAATAWVANWGPARDTFTIKKPAPYAVLDSITDGPGVGDHRNFVRVKDAAENGATYGDYVRARPGSLIDVAVGVWNEAADNLDGPAATIHGLEVKLYMPPSTTNPSIGATLSGKNAAAVWDGATVVTDSPMRLVYVPGSATFGTNGGTFTVPDAIGSGKATLLGYSALDGEFPVGYTSDHKYRGSGWLTFQVRVSPAG